MMKLLRIIFSAVLGVALLLLLAREIRASHLYEAFRVIRWDYFLSAFVVYAAATVTRSERFYILFGKRIPRQTILGISFLRNFFNTLFPFRAGELSYLYFVKKAGHIGTGEGVGSLIGMQMFDIASVLAIFSGVLLYLSRIHVVAPRVVVSVGVSFFVLAALWYACVLRGEKIRGFAAEFFAGTIRGGKLGAAAVRVADDALASLAVFRREKIALRIAILSLTGWAAIFLSGLLLLKGSGVVLHGSELFFAYAFPVAVSMSPFMAFGGFGSYEAALAFPLSLLGVNKEAAIISSIVIHIEELFFVVLLAGIGFVLYRMCRVR